MVRFRTQGLNFPCVLFNGYFTFFVDVFCRVCGWPIGIDLLPSWDSERVDRVGCLFGDNYLGPIFKLVSGSDLLSRLASRRWCLTYFVVVRSFVDSWHKAIFLGYCSSRADGVDFDGLQNKRSDAVSLQPWVWRNDGAGLIRTVRHGDEPGSDEGDNANHSLFKRKWLSCKAPICDALEDIALADENAHALANA